MVSKTSTSLFLLLTVVCEPAYSFHVNLNKKHGVNCAQLNLVPSQGSQLVAASCAAMNNKDKSLDAAPTLPDAAPTSPKNSNNVSAARSLISRIFNSPSHQKPYEHGLVFPTALLERGQSSSSTSNTNTDDILLYPITGFQWVAVDDLAFPQDINKKRYKAVPTSCTASCSIRAMREMKEQETYGWFSSCCFLDDSEDYHFTYYGRTDSDC